MTSDSVKLDDDGIPVLENPVTLDALPAQAGEPLPDLTDHEVVARLLQNVDVQHLLDDMSEDLQKLVAWKIESLVKDQVTQLIQTSTPNCSWHCPACWPTWSNKRKLLNKPGGSTISTARKPVDFFRHDHAAG